MNQSDNSAFPHQIDKREMPNFETHYGLTMLDYFAAKAMQSNIIVGSSLGYTDNKIVEDSYMIAAKMIRERKKY